MLIVRKEKKKFDAQGKILEESFYNTVHNFISEFLWLAETVRPAEVEAQ